MLKAIHTAELSRRDGGRNVLKLLSVNTRRTKVVALSTGTHRVPDELRRHQLADEEGNEYSTNLDRNRYGNDDQYLFTVIKFNLEALGLCPLIAQVEIIDAKAAKEECVLVVKVPDAGCTCDGGCVNGVRDGVHVAAREIVGGSAAQRESVARSNEQSARRARESGSGAKSSGDARTPRDSGKTKEQWRVPTTPMSPMKRNASAGDVGGMGMLLDALTQVGGMPPPSPLHLRSPPHGANVAGRRASFLSGGANMAAASPSMRPAAAAMSALCASAPPSADRDAVSHMGGVGGVAQAAAAAAAAAQYYGFAAAGQSNAQAQLLAIQQQHEQQQLLLFQSPPLMQKFAAAAAGLAPAPGASNGVNDFSIRRATPETLANESVLEELVERERGEAAAARAAEAKANARVAELERELQLATKKDEEDATGDDGAARAKAVKAEQTADAVAREDFAHRLVALEEEIAAFGARAEAAARNAGTAPAGGDAMTALYVAEARAHARALVRVARLEAAAALAPSKDDLAETTNAGEETIAAEGKGKDGEEADPEEGATVEASTPAAATAVENVASLAAVAEAEKRARDDDGFFEPPPRQATGDRDGRRQEGGGGGGGGGGGRCGGDRLRPADHSGARGRAQRPRDWRPVAGPARAGAPLCRRGSSVSEGALRPAGEGRPAERSPERRRGENDVAPRGTVYSGEGEVPRHLTMLLKCSSLDV